MKTAKTYETGRRKRNGEVSGWQLMCLTFLLQTSNQRRINDEFGILERFSEDESTTNLFGADTASARLF